MTEQKPNDPTFPPLMSGVGVSAPDQPFAFAVRGARDGSLGAGHVVWARNTSVVDWAIVLEPDVPLGRALQMVPLAMVAAGDCIGVLTPPQVGLMYQWPDTIMVNGGAAGHVEVAASTMDLEVVPDWLVVRLHVQLKRDARVEPGERPGVTSLDEEGCPDLTRSSMIESYSRHFLTWLNTWNDDGFHPIHSAWLFRAFGLKEDYSRELPGGQTVKGTFTGLDEDGNMLLKTPAGDMTLVTFADALLSMEKET